jgi:cystathionine beta-synthase
MGKGVFDDVTQVVGQTPLVKLRKLGRHTKAEIYAKLEYLNPGGSVKDRVAFRSSRTPRPGLLKPGGTIVEATSGNTGMGLALAAAVKGYKCIFVMPDKMSRRRSRPARLRRPRRHHAHRRRARRPPQLLLRQPPHRRRDPRRLLRQPVPQPVQPQAPTTSPPAPRSGTRPTARSTLRLLHGHRRHHLGTGRYLKEKNPDVKVIGVDPIGSLYYDYFKTGKLHAAPTLQGRGLRRGLPAHDDELRLCG